jgi:hypothetical protein
MADFDNLPHCVLDVVSCQLLCQALQTLGWGWGGQHWCEITVHSSAYYTGVSSLHHPQDVRNKLAPSGKVLSQAYITGVSTPTQ